MRCAVPQGVLDSMSTNIGGATMKLSRSVGYAVQATLYLARENSAQPVPCNRIAESGHLPERFLLQVLRMLVNCGVLRSTRGVVGGYRLARSPETISLLELIEAVDGKLAVAPPLPDDLPGTPNDKLQIALCDLTESLRQQLGDIRIANLM